MADRLQPQRLNRLSRSVLLHAALIPLLLIGCQSNAQQDLIARELRMQEDQIYAMEDYLTQYQQLLCDVRAENAALRRKLADVQGGESLPAPTPVRDESLRLVS